jgi:hypothetical protein
VSDRHAGDWTGRCVGRRDLRARWAAHCQLNVADGEIAPPFTSPGATEGICAGSLRQRACTMTGRRESQSGLGDGSSNVEQVKPSTRAAAVVTHGRRDWPDEPYSRRPATAITTRESVTATGSSACRKAITEAEGLLVPPTGRGCANAIST